MNSRRQSPPSQPAHERACTAVALEILDLLAEPGQPIMRELDSGAWIKVQRAFLLTKEQLNNPRDWRAQWLRENKLKPGELYVKLNRWTADGYHDCTYVQRVTTRQRIHVRPRHELLPLDYDDADLDPLHRVIKELEDLDCRIRLRASSMRDGYPHIHVLIACASYEQRLAAEAVVAEQLDRKMIRTHGISVPGFAGKVFRDGVRAVWNEKMEDFEDVPTYDRRQRDLMRAYEGTNLELLTELRDWLRQVPRWDLPDGVTLYGGTEKAPEVRSAPQGCPVETFEHEGRTYADTPLVRRHLGLPVDPFGLVTPVPSRVAPSSALVADQVAPPAAPEALPATLVALLDKDVPTPKKQEYDAYVPDEAARNAWAIMCVARQLGLAAERLWQERHRPGMKHFRRRSQLEREYAGVDATCTRGGDRRLAWALAAQQDPKLSVLGKRFVLHIAIRKGLVFGYRNLADAIGCSPMQIVHLTRDAQVLKYVEKTGNLIRPNQGREAQTFGIVEPPDSVEFPATLHSGTLGGICSKMAELRIAKLRWWDVLPTGETVLDAVTRLGGVQELGKEQQLAVWRLRVEDQRRTLARQEAQEKYYKQLEDDEAARASKRSQRELEREIALHENPLRVDDSIMHLFRPAA